MKKVAIPNVITCMRIIGSVALLIVPAFRLLFYIIFTLSGLTDALDGYLARRFSVESELGSKLDSIADLVFYGVMVIKLLPVMIEKMPLGIWILLISIVCVRIFIYILVAAKFHRFASLHTYLNKASGICAFLAPYFAPTDYFAFYCGAWCVLGAVAAIEEIAIHLTAKEYKPRKSIFVK